MSKIDKSNPNTAILDIHDLKTYYYTLRGPVKAVDSINFQVKKERHWD